MLSSWNSLGSGAEESLRDVTFGSIALVLQGYSTIVERDLRTNDDSLHVERQRKKKEKKRKKTSLLASELPFQSLLWFLDNIHQRPFDFLFGRLRHGENATILEMYGN